MTSYLLILPAETHNKEPLRWLLKTAMLALNIKNVSIGDNETSGYFNIHLNQLFCATRLCDNFFKYTEFLKSEKSFNSKGIIINEHGEDVLLTVFYLINSLQEYASLDCDALGRYKYESSYQKKFNVIEQNFVVVLLLSYFEKHIPVILENRVFEKSRFFLSHDIDSLYGAFLQDGLAALKKGRFDIIARLVFNAITLRPDWFNIDKIVNIENEYELKATFFWIVNKGRVSKTTTNADYSIDERKVRSAIQLVKSNGCAVGLHKSLSDESFDEELKKLNLDVKINRNHYLKFQLPNHYMNLSRSGIKIDCSLGFAEHQGFRNSLAIPFVPFNLETNQPYDFLEVPLNMMDGTYQKYMKVPADQVHKSMISLIEKNATNSVISVLWHNHFFSSYRFKEYFEPYVELLDYLRLNNFSFISPDELYAEYFYPDKE